MVERGRREEGAIWTNLALRHAGTPSALLARPETAGGLRPLCARRGVAGVSSGSGGSSPSASAGRGEPHPRCQAAKAGCVIGNRRAFAAASLVTLALGGCSEGGETEAGKLIVERATSAGGRVELLVSVDGLAARRPDLVTSARRVGLLCTDGSARTTVAARHPWPFLAEPGFERPHVHQPATPQQIERTKRCRLTDTQLAVEGVLR